MPRLAIITVLFRSNAILEGFIQSISLQQFKKYELYLVDNSPSEETDDLIKILTVKYPLAKFTHIKNDSNVGAAEGNNVGITKALKDGSDIILLTNTDIKIDDPLLLTKALQMMESTGEKIVVPKIFNANRAKIWMAGAGFNDTLVRGKHYGFEKDDSAEYNISREVKYAPTTFMFIKSEVFNSVGLLDPKYFAYFEDSDFIFRCNKKDYNVFYYADINVEHLESVTTGGSASVFAIYYTTRNRIYFTRKNVPFYKWFVAFPYIIAISLTRLFRYNTAQRKASIRGIFDGFKMGLS